MLLSWALKSDDPSVYKMTWDKTGFLSGKQNEGFALSSCTFCIGSIESYKSCKNSILFPIKAYNLYSTFFNICILLITGGKDLVSLVSCLCIIVRLIPNSRF